MRSAVSRIFDIIDALTAAPEGRTLMDIASATHIAKPTAHRLLGDLEKRNLVRRQPDATYALTLELPVLGNRLLAAQGFIDICQPELDRLAKRSGELVRLAWRDGDRLVYVAEAQGTHEGLRYDSNLGRVAILHATAVGKCFLASLTQEHARRAVGAQGLIGARGLGPNAIATMPALMTELARVKRRGFGTARDESDLGAAAVAAPIHDSIKRDTVIACLAVVGPSPRVSAADLTRMAPDVIKSAEALSQVTLLAPFCRKGEGDPRRRARSAE